MRFSLLLLASFAAVQPARSFAETPAQAPEFTHSSPTEWINSEPRTVASLQGRVVLVEFWTFDCVNCRRTLPWLKAMHARYRDEGLVIVSVHTPELTHERDAANVRAAVKKLGIDYPIMLDNDFSYWNALGNHYWPACYLIGRTGRIEAMEIGELHRGEARGDRFERQIQRLLAAR
jgi:thiol-disulfide isomerase/thioredoxin